MNREEMLARIEDTSEGWDFIVIGGGATGVGTAIEASSRGYRTLLLEQSDFAKGTSSRSTKLAHGGVRYLQQGNISLVLEALKERGLMFQNAPHLVHDLPFVVPAYDWWEGPFYGIGLKLYDLLAGKMGFGPSKLLSKEKTIKHIPTVETYELRGGVIYYDGQFDDARMVINMAETAAEQGASLLNYMQVTKLIKKNGMVHGVVAHDTESGKKYELNAGAVINATGVFADSVRRMDDPKAKQMISPSQGVHIVLNRSFLPGDSAIMVPKTDDGRVLFTIPWHDCVIVGTTDTPVRDISLEPRALDEEIEFLLSNAARYLIKDPQRSDVLSIYAGLRPLVGSGDEANTASISRDHVLHISRSGLITITGGKWTTYRKMAQDTIDHASVVAQLDAVPSVTHELHIHGYHKNAEMFGDLEIYGSDAPAVRDLLLESTENSKRLHPDMPTRVGEVIWAVRHEMARTVEDFLARRTRSLLLNARASIKMALKVAEIMAKELNRDDAWVKQHVEQYTKLAEGYILN
ncbi:MAG: glycerol-3-phosphate dehydrogenase/oxidase [Candidatus Latescibacteria bacterium]|nr:glycerol-3-phosphate dehydrogenase/oxidase [Candidatus Latescibacterota bacterium]